MERPGEKLKRIRERLKLTYRDVEKASQQIAERRGSDEFAIALSRLADIENKGTVPTMYRLYTLCAIYRQDLTEVLGWYGVPLDQLASEALHAGLDETHAIQFKPSGTVTVPQPPDLEIDPHKTTFLSYLVRNWGRMPLSFLDSLDLREYRYGLIGLEDWSMYPILQPGSLVVIDEGRRKIAGSGWINEFDRPIYFLEHRGGWVCGWCVLSDNRLLVQPHPASHRAPLVFEYPKEIDIIGQVIGVAMLLESRKHRHTRYSSAPEKSPNP
jgi:transcriptional regulator with XRE-family HTH domain